MSELEGRYWHFIDDIEPISENPEILLWVSLPLNHRGQSVEIQSFYPEPTEIIEDKINRNQVVFWRVTDLKGKESMYLYYDFKIAYEEVNVKIDPDKVEPYKKGSEEYQRYTKSESWVEIAPEVKKKAKEIVGDETNPYRQARRIFYWVRNNMTYEFPDMDHRGTKWAFETLKGDCGEFSHLFSGLCRATGIPCRNILSVLLPAGHHEWAEILLPPYGWVPVDVTRARSLKLRIEEKKTKEIEEAMERMGVFIKDPDYFFGNLYPKRLIVSIGNNIELISRRTGIKKIFKFMQPGGNVAYPPAIELKSLSERTVTEGFYIFGKERSNEGLAYKRAVKELTPFYLKAKAFDKAEKAALSRVKEEPRDSAALFYLAEVYMHTNRYEEAVNTFEKSIGGKEGSLKKPTDTWSHNFIGNFYDLKGMRQKAINEYKKAIEVGAGYEGAIAYAEKHLIKPFKKLGKTRIIIF